MNEKTHNNLSELDSLITKLNTGIVDLKQELLEAREALGSMADNKSSLADGIRNLQQAYITEHGNAETLEKSTDILIEVASEQSKQIAALQQEVNKLTNALESLVGSAGGWDKSMVRAAAIRLQSIEGHEKFAKALFELDTEVGALLKKKG